jgi:hypothetical protein
LKIAITSDRSIGGDVKPITNQGGITIFIEREIMDNTKTIEIKFDEIKGLVINLS